MALDASDVKKIAHLARLQIETSKAQDYATDLSNILEFVGQLQAVDTQNIKPMAHPLDATQSLRPDIVTEKNQRAKFQKIAPSTEDGLYLVPKVIE
ncbi:MAG: Asp-tRNA(Asn)/Glu-tRNA(Gln) amidotransferase GatCAB subunit C [Gammaproteobacteria bacterium]|nr:MAG: Asp-tRNA(Asn)/Glu-tRNA(Gln) amidotransferase GatCAB subunit C [Gammaproteobacteria bacterium]